MTTLLNSWPFPYNHEPLSYYFIKTEANVEQKKTIENVEAAIFDLDGVITSTAKVHAKAWKKMFDEFLNSRNEEHKPMDIQEDYDNYIDGKPRYKGVKDFLDSRNIDIPYGEKSDPAEKETVCGLGNRKNQIFQELIKTEGFEVFEDAVDQIKKWRSKGIKTAIISSSKNCKPILEKAELTHLFEERIDGVVSEELKLNGKPDPDIFLEAASRLNIGPDKAVIFEDAIAGIQAGKKGGFFKVIGINHNGSPDILKEHGADITITNMHELELVKEIQPGKLAIHSLSPALDHYSEIKNRLGNKKLALFLDYDGTLTPIVNNPDKAKLSSDMRQIIKSLSEQCTVSVISGRDRADVKEKVNLPEITYAGSHGLDISGPDIKHIVGEKALPNLDEIEKKIKRKLKSLEGATIERKKLVVAVHYREAKEKEKEIKNYLHELVDGYDNLKIIFNKMVVEIRPDINWDKGSAIEYLLEKLPLNDAETVPVFLGDDITDEDGFRAVQRKGVGIVVGNHGQKSFARYKLADQEEVKKFLHELKDILNRKTIHNWEVIYENYLPEEEPLREALATLGNGYFATRGTAEETSDDGTHYPGTYLAGGYNRAETEIAGKIIENEDLVNWPNWLCLSFRIKGGKWFHVDEVEIKDYQQIIDLRQGMLKRRIQFTDNEDRVTELVSKRFVSQHDLHLAGIEWTLKPINWSGKIEVKSALDARVRNNGVDRYKDLNSDHLQRIDAGKLSENGIYVLVRTKQSLIYMAEAARTEIYNEGQQPVAAERSTSVEDGYVSQVITFGVEKLKPVTIDKTVSLYSSRDVAIADPLTEAHNAIVRTGTFNEILTEHIQEWGNLWHKFEISLKEDEKDQMVLRLHIFHLLQTVSFKSIYLDVGVPSRGWHGEAYRGHIFWDEIFIFPLLNLRVPQITATLLMYRYRRLTEARANAKASGYKGAMFPWQSGSNGKEESQNIHLNPESGQWLPDNTFLQRHINANIVYNIVQYYYATEDKAFINLYGAEMILDIANFFSSMASWSDEKERYVICNIVGPDEYHTQYPQSEEPGIHNNAYTNIMVSYVLQVALSMVKELEPGRKAELFKSLKITEDDLGRWAKVSKEIYVPFIKGNILAQFEGYDNLEELDWDKYHNKYGDFLRLDRILEAEGEDVNKYKASKQADVLMLFYLFTMDELQGIFEHMGYPFDETILKANMDYYYKRTSHGSTLSQLVHSWVLAKSDRKSSWHSFQKALLSDFQDVQGGTTPEGIHLGAMAGTVDLVQRCYTGISLDKDALWINPQLPENLKEVKLRVRYRAKWIRFIVNHKKLELKVEEGWGGAVSIGVKGKKYKLKDGDSKTFNI